MTLAKHWEHHTDKRCWLASTLSLARWRWHLNLTRSGSRAAVSYLRVTSLTGSGQVNAAWGLTNLTSAHHIRVLCQEIHNFSLPLVAPLSPQDHGHSVADGRSGSAAPVRGRGGFLTPTFRHFCCLCRCWLTTLLRSVVPLCRCCCTKDDVEDRKSPSTATSRRQDATRLAHAHKCLKSSLTYTRVRRKTWLNYTVEDLHLKWMNLTQF